MLMLRMAISTRKHDRMRQSKRILHNASPGLYGRLQALYGRLGDRLYEVNHGIDTSARPDDGVADHTRESVEYKPIQFQVLRRVFRSVQVGPDDAFLDPGAGKGRVVLQAAQLPFRRFIGVEVSETLSAQARRNIDRKRGRQACRSAEIVTTDASAFRIPDDVTVIYMFNPFWGETFEAVAQNILQSFERRPRRITLIYFLPTMHEYLIANGFTVLRQALGSLRVEGAPNAGRSYLVICGLGADPTGLPARQLPSWRGRPVNRLLSFVPTERPAARVPRPSVPAGSDTKGGS
jgi:predicted RNA methylase